MGWAFRNRIIYLGGLFLILLIVFGLPIYNSFNKEPTCFDGKKNGKELGVDCGGGCSKVCDANATNPIIIWSRSFEVRDGVYNSIAMIENQNPNAGAKNVNYTFKLFDERNVLVYERKGIVDIPAQSRFPVFESNLVAGNRIPEKTFFDFTSPIDWRAEEDNESDLRVSEREIKNLESSPRVNVVLENRGLTAIKNLEVFAIVYDMADNAMASSKTIVDNISPDSSREIVFTWPNPFKHPFGRIEIIPKFEF